MPEVKPLTKSYLRNIRLYATMNEKWFQKRGLTRPTNCAVLLDLLGEIDRLREENDRLKNNIPIHPIAY